MWNFIRIFIFMGGWFLLPACSLLSTLQEPNLQALREDRFKDATDHDMLKVYLKDSKLGFVFENGHFTKQIWGGKTLVSPSGQTIKLLYTQENFDQLKLFLGDDLSIGPGMESVHHVKVLLEDIKIHELTDFQPLMEYMGENQDPLLNKPFVVSMIQVSKFSVEAYQKVQGDFGIEYRPYPLLKIKGGTGASTEKSEEQSAYNIFVGYKLFDGARWMQDFSSMPRVKVSISNPPPETIVDQVRTRVKGKIDDYHTVPDLYKNQMRLYIMTRNEYQDDWLLQSNTTIDVNGNFEGIVKLGTLEEGNGHRYSIAAFISYFKINREVNSVIPILPFNKGKDVVNVKREDNF